MATLGDVVGAKALADARAALGIPAAAKSADAAKTERQQIDVAKLLANGGVAVVVGGRPSNFDQKMRDHPQCVFWDSTDPKASGKPLPTNARVALLLPRFIDHSWCRRVKAEAQARGVPALLLQSTGDIKDMLQPVVDRPKPQAPDPEPLPVVTPQQVTPPTAVAWVKADPPPAQIPEVQTVPLKTRPPIHGELKTFVLTHAKPDASIEEAQRMLGILRTAGVETSIDSIRVAIRSYLVNPKRANGHSDEPAAPEPARPAVVPDLQPARIAVAAAPSSPKRDLLLERIDEAQRYIDEIRTSAELLGEILPDLRNEIQRFRDKQRQARELWLE